MTVLLTTGDEAAPVHLVLAHGAGAPMTSPFLDDMARLLAERGIAVSRFEFAYMAARRWTGKRQPPPKVERLMAEFDTVVCELAARLRPGQKLMVGGKSMGGRVASLVAERHFQERRISGLVVLGYPFHPPKEPGKLRTAHLGALSCPTLVVQGERDPFGTRGEVEALATEGILSPAISVVWAADGDHDLGPRGRSGTTRGANLTAAADAIAAFAQSGEAEQFPQPPAG